MFCVRDYDHCALSKHGSAILKNKKGQALAGWIQLAARNYRFSPDLQQQLWLLLCCALLTGSASSL
jgi:hypothetical protein